MLGQKNILVFGDVRRALVCRWLKGVLAKGAILVNKWRGVQPIKSLIKETGKPFFVTVLGT